MQWGKNYHLILLLTTGLCIDLLHWGWIYSTAMLIQCTLHLCTYWASLPQSYYLPMHPYITEIHAAKETHFSPHIKTFLKFWHTLTGNTRMCMSKRQSYSLPHGIFSLFLIYYLPSSFLPSSVLYDPSDSTPKLGWFLHAELRTSKATVSRTRSILEITLDSYGCVRISKATGFIKKKKKIEQWHLCTPTE